MTLFKIDSKFHIQLFKKLMGLLPFYNIAFMFVVMSCATFNEQYSKSERNWDQRHHLPTHGLKHTMYLLGDAGNSTSGNALPVLTYLKTKLATESQNSSVLFLGDNIYENGMPPREDSEMREEAEQRIKGQLEILDDYKGRPIFIPGNHDWRGWGQQGLKRQEHFIESYLNNKRGKADKDEWENYFLPDDGCSGPEVVELNDQVVVIVIDSQWWLGNGEKEPKMGEGCEAKNKASFKFIFENIVRKYRNKSVVIALHHPPYTYGPHGGSFTAKQHIFPLTDINPKLFLPLPGIGTAAQVFRASVGSAQDVAHMDYKELRSALMAGSKKNGSFIFASGHEHALQYIETGGQHFVVSGSASKQSPAMLGKGSKFSSGAPGFSTLSFYEGGETWVQFWEVNAAGKASVLFAKKIRSSHETPIEQDQIDFHEYEQRHDSIDQYLTREKVAQTSQAHNFVFGTHHRDLYLEKYSFPILDLDTFKNGVTPVKQGGGNQTNSLRVRDSDDREYVLRGVTKDASRFLPYPFNKMVAAKYLVEDNFLATHPFAPLAIPHLADAIHVYHTNPRLFYVPAQPQLGVYNKLFGGSLHLVEERPAGKNWESATFFGSPEKIISTADLIENIINDNHHQVDEEWALRTRLLDFLIGDWDRHDDQWTWACIDQPNGFKLYRPIPRDRDQAFSRYDGMVPTIARQTLPFLRQLQSYGPEINSVKWTTWSARLFDRTFLNELSWKQWEEQVRFIQDHLTDKAIDSSFEDWPQKARELSAGEISRSIKARRDNLMIIARRHYEFLSESVDIIGTEAKERFEVERLDDAYTRVTVYDGYKKSEAKRITFQRTFENSITNSIILYGDGNDDVFLVSGDVNKGITVRLVGGLGQDKFTDSSYVKRGERKTIIYDDLRKNSLTSGPETRDRRSSLSRFNIYDRRGYDSEYDIVIPMPNIGFNPDDVFLLGASFNIIRHGFKKVPYASLQQVGGSFAFGTSAFKLNYKADFVNAIRSLDLYLDARYHGPTYSFNFAGLGNNSLRTNEDPDYYRVRQAMVYLYPAVKKRFAGMSGYFTLGPVMQTTDIEKTAGRFIEDYGAGENDNLFDRKYFGGAQLGIHYNNVDNFFAPHSGMRFNSDFSWARNIRDGESFISWNAQMEVYQRLGINDNVVLATQIGAGQTFGDGYEFFQMATLGGSQGLRGYRTERFYGNSSFWQSTDLRVKVISSRNRILPFTIGVFGGFDYGRVWLQGESSGTWHNSWGGGVWLAPIDALVISMGTYVPKEDFEESPRFVFRAGFSF